MVMLLSDENRILQECSCIIKFIKQVVEEIKCEAYRTFYLFFSISLINSIIQEHECSILFII